MACPKTALAVTSLVSLWALGSNAWANGGTPQLTKAQAGPYMVSVWTQPEPPRVGLLHISVAVMRPPTGEPVLDATVRLTAQSLDQPGARLVAHATREQGNSKLFYDTTLALPTPGRWRFTVQVQGAAGEGSAAFTLTAMPPASLPWLFLGLAGIAVGFAVMWLLRRS
jgi:hypothetical protein